MLSTEQDNLVQLKGDLIRFYADARKKDKRSALKVLRFGLARHFLIEMDFDIIKIRFKRVSGLFKAVSVAQNIYLFIFASGNVTFLALAYPVPFFK